nr:hypothetical protein [Tanacetum cinerariifolium]GEY76131.1 hypothetical protein [Tanacetum cinerariifolium]
MDSIIPLGQKNTLAKYMILSGANNRRPMLDKDLYDLWKIQMELYMQNREHGRMILESFDNGPLIWPTIEENGVTRTKKYAELSAAKKIQADCESYKYHSSSLPPKWNKFMTDVKLVKDFHTRNFDQLHAYLEQHELHANEVRLLQSQCNKYRRDKIKAIVVLGEEHMARQCTQPKQPRNETWYKEKAMLAEAQKAGQFLDEEQFAFLADPGVPDGQAVQTIIPNNSCFQTEDLDTYDSNCDDFSNIQAVLMANISNYGSDVVS